jgi:hypothetical protein
VLKRASFEWQRPVRARQWRTGKRIATIFCWRTWSAERKTRSFKLKAQAQAQTAQAAAQNAQAQAEIANQAY